MDNYQICARLRSTENIVEEIKLRIRQGYTRFQSCDLSLNPDVSRLEEICRLIISAGLKIKFTFGQLRHSRHLTPKTFSLMRKAGFDTICFGSESGSQTILDRMRKGVDLKTMACNIRDAYSQGLKVILFFIVGFPGETEETFLETLCWVKANARYISAVKHVAPLALNWGSYIHDDLEFYGVDPNNLFQSPDIWKTKDGLNNYLWRSDLSKRMLSYLHFLDIPCVEFEGGNPVVPKERGRIAE